MPNALVPMSSAQKRKLASINGRKRNKETKKAVLCCDKLTQPTVSHCTYSHQPSSWREIRLDRTRFPTSSFLGIWQLQLLRSIGTSPNRQRQKLKQKQKHRRPLHPCPHPTIADTEHLTTRNSEGLIPHFQLRASLRRPAYRTWSQLCSLR